MSSETELITGKIRKWLVLFMVGLVLSGVTAFPLETELKWLVETQILPITLQLWTEKVYWAIAYTNENYPFLAYGTDWLAFAHIVIALAFIGPYMDPVRNKWVIQFGRIACLMIFPLAFICGPIRGIPLYWQIIDCSFGLIGLIPLTIIYRHINRLEAIQNEKVKEETSKLEYLARSMENTDRGSSPANTKILESLNT